MDHGACPVSSLYYEDTLERKIKSLHMENARLTDEIQALQNLDRPVIHLLRASGDLLPEVEWDTITFELEYTGARDLKIGNTRLTASLKFARRTYITAEQAQPVLDEFIADVREWFAETFQLEPVA